MENCTFEIDWEKLPEYIDKKMAMNVAIAIETIVRKMEYCSFEQLIPVIRKRYGYIMAPWIIKMIAGAMPIIDRRTVKNHIENMGIDAESQRRRDGRFITNSSILLSIKNPKTPVEHKLRIDWEKLTSGDKTRVLVSATAIQKILRNKRYCSIKEIHKLISNNEFMIDDIPSKEMIRRIIGAMPDVKSGRIKDMTKDKSVGAETVGRLNSRYNNGMTVLYYLSDNKPPMV